MLKNQISPSILSADFGRLNDEIKEIEPYSDRLHVDVMDGHFVDNLTFGPVVTRHIRTKLPVDVHLMIANPLRYIPDFAGNCDSISFHPEVYGKKDLVAVIHKIKEFDLQVGLALNPDKPVKLIDKLLDQIDYVLIMSVFAGFGGQNFMKETLDKVRWLRSHGFNKDIMIDGGISVSTIRSAKEAGANVFIAGTAIFSKKDRKMAISDLRGAIR